MGSQRNGFKKESFILSVDIGTTSIRCHVYDKEAHIRGSCTTKVFNALSLNLSVCCTLKYTTDLYHCLCSICMNLRNWEADLFILVTLLSRLLYCIQRWGMWRWTQMHYGRGLLLWSEELCKVWFQPFLLCYLFVHKQNCNKLQPEELNLNFWLRFCQKSVDVFIFKTVVLLDYIKLKYLRLFCPQYITITITPYCYTYIGLKIFIACRF